MIDCHVHLDDERYGGRQKEIIGNFEKDGIDFIINSSSSYSSMNSSRLLAQNYERVYSTVGLHPDCIEDLNDRTSAEMEKIAAEQKTVAVGEIGLDYHYPDTDKEKQKDAFAAQIELADKCGLPVVLHIRDAWSDALDMLKAQNKFLNNGVMFHCYSGSGELTRQLAAKGWYFSFGGSMTYVKAQKRYAILSAAPIGQIVTETDAPYLAPEPYRGQTNYPKYVRYVLPVLADAYGLSVEEMENQVLYNAKKFFKKIK